MSKSIGLILLFVNFINVAILNVVFISGIFLLSKRLLFFKPLLPILLFVLLQALITHNTERFMQNCIYIIHLACIYMLVFKTNFMKYRDDIIKAIILIHTILFVYFLFTGFNFGRVKEGGFVGIFDEASVCAMTFSIIFLIFGTNLALATVLIFFILMAKSVTGIFLLGIF